MNQTLADRSYDSPIRLVPTCCTAEGFALHPGCADGIAIDALEVGTTLVVRTRRSEYRLIVLDGPPHTLLVQGGLLLTEPTEACLQGSSAGGSYVKTGWIGVGLCVEILAGGKRIVTSRVQDITIESVPPRPRGSRISA
jgi:hypothetical protein